MVSIGKRNRNETVRICHALRNYLSSKVYLFRCCCVSVPVCVCVLRSHVATLFRLISETKIHLLITCVCTYYVHRSRSTKQTYRSVENSRRQLMSHDGRRLVHFVTTAYQMKTKRKTAEKKRKMNRTPRDGELFCNRIESLMLCERCKDRECGLHLPVPERHWRLICDRNANE